MSSISGSDTDEDGSSSSSSEGEGADNDDKDDNNGGAGRVYRGQSHYVEFQTRAGEFVTVCKTLLLRSPREAVTVEEVLARLPLLFRGTRWAIFMCSGGHFAGVCFDGQRVVAHKTIHKYTTRRKQGGSQAAQDSTGKRAKSAGATIRRNNELALQQEIRALLAEWAPLLREATHIFIQAPGIHNTQIFFGHEGSPLTRGDERLRRIPFSTRRPTFAEVRRLHALLSSATFSRESMYLQQAADSAREAAQLREKKERALERKQRLTAAAKEKQDKVDGTGAGAGAGPGVALTKEQELVLQACRKGKRDLLASVLSKHADFDLDFADERGWTSLHVAANEGFDEVVTVLLDHGANPAVTVKGIKVRC